MICARLAFKTWRGINVQLLRQKNALRPEFTVIAQQQSSASNLGRGCSPMSTLVPISNNKLLDPVVISGASILNVSSQRTFIRKRNRLVKIPPTKPLHFDYSGDIEKELKPLDLSAARPGYEHVEELQQNEVVQKIFSLEFADGQSRLKKQLEKIEFETKEHDADIRSKELQIAKDTIRIRNQITHCLAFRKDKICKSLLIERIYRRQKQLRLLRQRDIEKFNWLTDKLKIDWKPIPKFTKKLTKKAARKQVARNAFLDTKQQKLEDFRANLAAQRAVFEEHKEKELAEIEGLLKQFGIEKMESPQQVMKDLGLGEPYVQKKEKPKSRRERILEMKFELYKNLPKNQKKW